MHKNINTIDFVAKCIFCNKNNKPKHITENKIFAAIHCCGAYQQCRRSPFSNDNVFKIYNYQILLKDGNIVASKNIIQITYKKKIIEKFFYTLHQNFPYVNQHNAQTIFDKYIKSMILK